MKSLRAEIEGRPALVAALAMVLGMLAVPTPMLLTVALVALIALRPPARLLAAGFLVVGALISPRPPMLTTETTFGEWNCEIATVPKWGDGEASFTARCGGLRYRVYTADDPRLTLGARIRIAGQVRPSAPDARDFYRRMGWSAQIRAHAITVTESGAWFAETANAAARSFDAYAQTVTRDANLAALLSAYVGGLDGGLSDEEQDLLRNSGTLHLVAASGFQVALIATIVMGALSRAPMPRGGQLLVWTVAVAMYALVAGLAVSILRAALMAVVLAGAYLLRRSPDFLSALGLSAILILLWRPESLYEVGFGLSYVAVAALGLFAHGESGIWNWREAVRASAVAFGFTAPLIAWSFGQIPVLGLLANVLLGGLMFPLILVSLMGWALYAVFPPSADAFAALIRPWLGWTQLVIEHTTGVIAIPTFNGWWLLPVYAAMFGVWRFRRAPA